MAITPPHRRRRSMHVLSVTRKSDGNAHNDLGTIQVAIQLHRKGALHQRHRFPIDAVVA